MHRLSALVRSFIGRPRRSLIVLGICTLVLAGASPLLWAGYHWYAGRAAYKRYHNTEARRHLDACLKIWPWSRSVETHLLAVRAARREGDLLEAFEHLQRMQSRLGDKSPETVLEWAMLHAAGGDLENVEGFLLNELRNDSPHTLVILEALSEGYLRMGRSAHALRGVEELLTRDPENLQALYLRSNIYRQGGSWAKSIPDLRRVVELDPERPPARWWLAVALVNVGRYDEAVGHLETLRQLQPDDIDVLARLAICRHYAGRDQEANALLETVLAQRPDHGQALLTRGQMAQDKGQLEVAEEWFHRAAQALPYDYKAHWMLSQCLRKQEGKTEQAEAEEAYANQLLDRWSRFSEITVHELSQNRNNPALFCEAGKLMFELGNPEGGKRWLSSALVLDQHYVPALTALADYYEKSGDGATAEDYRRRAQQSSARQAQDETSNANPRTAGAGAERGGTP
jgi:tetratricopeptide (TPR) repeat protein